MDLVIQNKEFSEFFTIELGFRKKSDINLFI